MKKEISLEQVHERLLKKLETSIVDIDYFMFNNFGSKEDWESFRTISLKLLRQQKDIMKKIDPKRTFFSTDVLSEKPKLATVR